MSDKKIDNPKIEIKESKMPDKKEEIIDKITYNLERISLMASLSQIATMMKGKEEINYALVFSEIAKDCQNVSGFIEDLEGLKT